MGRAGRLAKPLLLLCLGVSGCSFGPKALEHSHRLYNESVKQVTEEQLLLNLIRLRYNDDVVQLDLASIAAQYELGGSVEARPFNSSQAARFMGPSPYATFSTILPFAGVTGAQRPTMTLTPLDDPETIRGLFRPGTLDGIAFLAETSWPVSTIFRLWVESLNGVPNAVTASGPPQELFPRFRRFRRAVELLQVLQDRGELRFARVEKLVELGHPIPADNLTPAALIEADKNGYEYRQRPDKAWALLKRDRRLELKLGPAALGSPEVLELCQLLHLQPGLASYEVTVGGADVFEPCPTAERSSTIKVVPRSTVQALFYLAHGVVVPPEHVEAGVVKPTLGPDGSVFDWQEVLGGLFTVHSCRQHGRPKDAWVAVRYRDRWFYVDDRDNDSKTTFTLMMVMMRANLIGPKKSGPALTLPVGR